jgi:hypothetical protein
VASSCAIPGYFPTVEFEVRRYMDGPRGGFWPRLVEEKRLDAVLFIGPLGALPEGLRADPEMDALAARGFPVLQVTGGDALALTVADLMSSSARSPAVDVGFDNGRAAAPDVIALMR